MCATFPNPQDCLERTTTDISSDSDPISHKAATSSSAASFATMAFALLLPPAILAFSLSFPFVIPYVSHAASATYIPASYRYDEIQSRFDNSAWTWGTDYLLTFVMGAFAFWILAIQTASRTAGFYSCRRLQLYSMALLACYGISTLAGGYAHQTVRGVDNLNTLTFRWLWIVCVGNVSFASCWMGLIGREVNRLLDGRLPSGPGYLWPFYGAFMTCSCAMGYMSFKRPACDIFIAGITQFPSTFYCLGGLMMGVRNYKHGCQRQITKNRQQVKQHPMENVLLRYRIMYYVGFIGNAPLLPMYPLLVQYTDMSLAGINTLLHSWLMAMWGMQGISLLHICRVVAEFERANEMAVDKKD